LFGGRGIIREFLKIGLTQIVCSTFQFFYRHIMFFRQILLIISISVAAAFQPGFFKSSRHHQFSSLLMSSVEQAKAALKAKLESDPSYNPTKDPQVQPLLQEILPSHVRDISNSLGRLKVSFQDATSGTEAVEDLNASAASFPNKAELISSPQSAWFKSGSPDDDVPFDNAKKQALLSKLKK
jgi:hypothetical protein